MTPQRGYNGGGVVLRWDATDCSYTQFVLQMIPYAEYIKARAKDREQRAAAAAKKAAEVANQGKAK